MRGPEAMPTLTHTARGEIHGALGSIYHRATSLAAQRRINALRSGRSCPRRSHHHFHLTVLTRSLFRVADMRTLHLRSLL